jgi:hypothetical protein
MLNKSIYLEFLKKRILINFFLFFRFISFLIFFKFNWNNFLPIRLVRLHLLDGHSGWLLFTAAHWWVQPTGSGHLLRGHSRISDEQSNRYQKVLNFFI